MAFGCQHKVGTLHRRGHFLEHFGQYAVPHGDFEFPLFKLLAALLPLLAPVAPGWVLAGTVCEVNRATWFRTDFDGMAALRAIHYNRLCHVFAWFLVRRERLLGLCRLGKVECNITIACPIQGRRRPCSVAVVICTSLGFSAICRSTCFASLLL